MAIPQKTLVINDSELDELTLEENRILFGERYNVDAFYQYLIDHVDHANSWTIRDIGKIKRRELDDVRSQVANLINERAVPLAN